jgi:hypothetical protein
VHQKALTAAANECTALVREAWAKLDEIDCNRDLTPEAKNRKRAELASELIGKLEASKMLTRAREAAEYVLQKYESNINSKLQPATDPQSVGIHQQIRQQLLAITDPRERLKFLERHGNDLTLISACLSAPLFLSGLADHELALLHKNLEAAAPPEVIKERDFVHSALAEIKRGFRAARARIAKRGGLEKAPDANWGQAVYARQLEDRFSDAPACSR